MASCRAPECAYEELSRSRSADALHDVVTYVSSCGAMTGARWGVAVLPSGSALSAGSEIRVLHYADSMGASGSLRPPTATWSPAGGLHVRYDPRADVITKVAVVARIPVTYERDEPGLSITVPPA